MKMNKPGTTRKAQNINARHLFEYHKIPRWGYPEIQTERRVKTNLGAKVLSARLAKVLNHLITLLTTCLCKATEHVAKSGEIRQRPTNRDNSGG